MREREAKAMATVVHFEIPADNVERAKKFYGELFGWKIEKLTGSSPMDYWMVMTGREEGQMGVDGGLMQRQHPQQQTIVYIDVPSVDEYLGKVKNLGGQVVLPRMAIPGMGYIAVCLDPENNGFGLWENNPEAQ
jgi:predicted enzyme related to lactoylglutathione lyase